MCADAQRLNADDVRPHRLPDSCIGPDAPGEELLAWKCKLCGEWVSEYEWYAPRTACPGAQIDGPEIEYPVVLPRQEPKNVRRYKTERIDGTVSGKERT